MVTDRQPVDPVAGVWLLHALYFVVGGIWAVVGKASFEAITGPKTDYWLVRTVGGLLAVVGAVIGASGATRRLTAATAWLAIGTSAVLTAVDIVYTSRRRIRKVYLLDALANLILIVGWAALLRRGIPADADRSA